MLVLRNINKSFGDRKILSGLNLELKQGGIFTLMGANGAGKTTLFNILTGFSRADKGSIFFKKKNLNNLPPTVINALGISRTFQNLRLIEGLTVKENILLSFKGNKGENIWNALLPRSFLGEHKAHFEHRAEEIIKKVFLDDVSESKAGEISFGQQKLLTLGCCLANDADLLLLDEPVAGVNQVYTGKIVSLLKSIKEAGKTIFLIEHHADFIEVVSDKLFFLTSGTIVAFSSYDQLKNNPTVQESYL